MITYSDVEHLLETYSLEEILELNELTDADVLFLLLKHNLVEIPNPRPLDVR